MLVIAFFFLLAFIINHFVDPLRGRAASLHFEEELKKGEIEPGI